MKEGNKSKENETKGYLRNKKESSNEKERKIITIIKEASSEVE